MLEKAARKAERLEEAAAARAHAVLVDAAEAGLKHVDTEERRVHLKRQEQVRRDKLSDHLVADTCRVIAFHAVKKEVQEQRAHRAAQQAVLKARPMDIQNFAPGPGAYGGHVSCLHELPVTKIAPGEAANFTPGSVEMMIRAGRGMPPPGAYEPKSLRMGDNLDLSKATRIVKFGPPSEKKRTFVDDACIATRGSPGPAAYGLPSTLQSKRGAKLVPAFKERDLPTYVPKPKDTPGPDVRATSTRARSACSARRSPCPRCGRPCSSAASDGAPPNDPLYRRLVASAKELPSKRAEAWES